MNRAVFLDRDNTLIANDGDLGDPALVTLMRTAAVGVASMRGLGYKIIVVTNQGGVARGRFTEDDVNAVHTRINELLEQQANGSKVDRFYFCPYHPEGSVPKYRREHPWRKPQPGMIEQAAKDLKLDLSTCWMIGDQPRDIAAGKAAGVRTIQLSAEPRGQGELPLDPDTRPDFFATNLIDAARVVAQHIRPEAAVLGGGEATDAPTAKPPVSTPASPRTTFPATQQLGANPLAPHQPRQSQRPFKPWSIQPVSHEDADDGSPVESTRRATQPSARTEFAPSPAPSPSQARPAVQSPPSRVPPIEPDVDDEPTTQQSPTDRLLEQLLREMKGARAHEADWSMMKTAAIAGAQPFAAFCALMAVFNVDQPMTLLTWLTGAILGQLIVITLLLLHWQK